MKIKESSREIAKYILLGMATYLCLEGLYQLYLYGLIDPTVVISTFLSVGLIALISGTLLYKFVYKKLTGSMIGGFM